MRYITTGSPPAERWIASLSPRKRSCVSYSNLEPCVNKAVQNLLILKQEIQQDVVRKQSSSCTSQHDLKSSNVRLITENVSEGGSTDLTVKGKASNIHFQIIPEQEKYNEFIEAALFLILRLDKDTRETTLKLEAVKEKVCSLRETLDVEAVRRMVLLREAVQEGNETSVINAVYHW